MSRVAGIAAVQEIMRRLNNNRVSRCGCARVRRYMNASQVKQGGAGENAGLAKAAKQNKCREVGNKEERTASEEATATARVGKRFGRKRRRRCGVNVSKAGPSPSRRAA
jgi:hypothetical protein